MNRHKNDNIENYNRIEGGYAISKCDTLENTIKTLLSDYFLNNENTTNIGFFGFYPLHSLDDVTRLQATGDRMKYLSQLTPESVDGECYFIVRRILTLYGLTLDDTFNMEDMKDKWCDEVSVYHRTNDNHIYPINQIIKPYVDSYLKKFLPNMKEKSI